MKIAVSIPDDVFEEAEAEAHRRGVTRSALYTAALRELVHRDTTIDAAIVAGYRAHPQGGEIDVDALPPMDDLGSWP